MSKNINILKLFTLASLCFLLPLFIASVNPHSNFSAAAQAEELNRLIAQYGDDLKGNTLKQKQFAGMLGISVDRLMEGIEAQSLQSTQSSVTPAKKPPLFDQSAESKINISSESPSGDQTLMAERNHSFSIL